MQVLELEQHGAGPKKEFLKKLDNEDDLEDHHEAAAYIANAGAIAASELGNRLEVRHEATGQPHQFDITLALALQTSARLHAIEIAVDVKFEQNGGMVRRSARDRRRGAFEAHGSQIEFVYECVDDPHGIVLSDKVFETLRQQRGLIAACTFDESPHLRLSR